MVFTMYRRSVFSGWSRQSWECHSKTSMLAKRLCKDAVKVRCSDKFAKIFGESEWQNYIEIL